MSTGIVRTFYYDENIALCEEYFQINGKKNGEYKAYHINGELKVCCNYLDDLKIGEMKEYYDNKQLCSSVCYVNDKREGYFAYYNKNGSLSRTCYYINNLVEGEYKEYDYNENGQIIKIYYCVKNEAVRI
jgi:antitoxin component YwqK of YwqJK toxin-antitoxin module